MEGHREALFYIGPVGITSVIISMLAITLGLTVLSYFATRRMQVRPVGLQNFMETCIEALHNFLADIMGEKQLRPYFPFLATLFIFIFVSNYSGMIPFSGNLPGLAAPTSSINVTAALAICAFCVTQYTGFKQHGFLGYLKHFIKPFAFMLPMFVIDELIRPLSLTLRLYGNVFGDEMVVNQFFNLVPLGLPVLFQCLSLLIYFLQAIIFVLLTSVYINAAIEEDF